MPRASPSVRLPSEDWDEEEAEASPTESPDEAVSRSKRAKRAEARVAARRRRKYAEIESRARSGLPKAFVVSVMVAGGFISAGFIIMKVHGLASVSPTPDQEARSSGQRSFMITAASTVAFSDTMTTLQRRHSCIHCRV